MKKEQTFEFGDKVTDVLDNPERNYIVLKRRKGNQIQVCNKSLDQYFIHKLRLRLGWVGIRSLKNNEQKRRT